MRDDKLRMEAVDSLIREYGEVLKERTSHHLGYPYNLDFDFGPLEGLLKYSINNLGDPFIESNYGVHSRQFEIGVLQWFARLWEISEDDYWGYVTNCGTEASLSPPLTPSNKPLQTPPARTDPPFVSERSIRNQFHADTPRR